MPGSVLLRRTTSSVNQGSPGNMPPTSGLSIAIGDGSPGYGGYGGYGEKQTEWNPKEYERDLEDR